MSDESSEKRNWLGPYIPQNSFVREAAQQLKLIYNLFLDKRVHPVLKVIPAVAVTYLFLPDISLLLAPFGGLIPGIESIDDALIMWFGLRTFVELAPPYVVTEHLRRLAAGDQGPGAQPGDWKVVDTPPAPPPAPKSEVVDDG